jgi:hypothetical protein
MIDSKRLNRFILNKKDAKFRELVSIADAFTKLAKEKIPSDAELNKLILTDPELAEHIQIIRISDAINKISKTDLKGEKGDRGEPGRDGIDGADGRNGESIVGPQGPQGIPGINGKNGRDGKQGPRGERGPAGLDGNDGKDGRDGKDGIDGKDGSPDTPEQIYKKLSELKGEDRMISNSELEQVIRVLDQRSYFSMNKAASSLSSTRILSEVVTSDTTVTILVNGVAYKLLAKSI